MLTAQQLLALMADHESDVEMTVAVSRRTWAAWPACLDRDEPEFERHDPARGRTVAAGPRKLRRRKCRGLRSAAALGGRAGHGGRAPADLTNVWFEKYLTERRRGRDAAGRGSQGGVDLFGLGN